MFIYNKFIAIFVTRLFASIFFPGLMLLCKNVYGQQKVGCNEITADMGYTLKSVTIKGRWVPKELQQKVEGAAGLGMAFDPARVAAAMEMVRTEIIKGEALYVIQLTGSTSVLIITSDICNVSDEANQKQAAIVIRPFYLRIDLYNVGDNILPIPRTAKPTFYTRVPDILLSTAPRFGLSNDRRYGLSANIETNTDLLHLPGTLKTDKHSKKFNLYLNLNARKSINDLFNTLGAGLHLNHPVYTDSAIGWDIGMQYAYSLQPIGEGDYKLKSTRFYGSISGNLPTSFFKKYAMGAAIGFLQNSYDFTATSKTNNPENSFEFYALADGRAGHGFNRMGIWFNAGVPKNNTSLKPYQRLAARLGYAIALGKTHNNVDVEANIGAGYTWGTAPLYNQFYAGNAVSNFLNVPLKSQQVKAFPEGPVIRSLGEHEGGFDTSAGIVSGGSSYWHLNLNFSIPISKWALPLIPDIIVIEETGATARKAIKGQANFAQSLIQIDLVDNHGYTEEAADIESERIVNNDIRPALNYLTDRANVYSVKPMFFFDIAQVNKRGFQNKWFGAAGAGLQLNIVNARLDIGYMQTFLPLSDKSKGNFLMKFTVQDLF